MQKLNQKSTDLKGQKLSRAQMKDILGGGGIIIPPFCFRCCPDDPCSPVRHVCLDTLCNVL